MIPRLVSAPTRGEGTPLSCFLPGSFLARVCAFRGKTSFNGVNRRDDEVSARAHRRDTRVCVCHGDNRCDARSIAREKVGCPPLRRSENLRDSRKTRPFDHPDSSKRAQQSWNLISRVITRNVRNFRVDCTRKIFATARDISYPQ